MVAESPPCVKDARNSDVRDNLRTGIYRTAEPVGFLRANDKSFITNEPNTLQETLEENFLLCFLVFSQRFLYSMAYLMFFFTFLRLIAYSANNSLIQPNLV